MVLGGSPLPPLTENHSARKPLAELGYPPSPWRKKKRKVVFDGFPLRTYILLHIFVKKIHFLVHNLLAHITAQFISCHNLYYDLQQSGITLF